MTSNLDDIIESSFYLSYHAGIQPSEVDKLTTYEFRKYIMLLNDKVKEDMEFDVTLAKNFGVGGLLRQRGDN